MAAWGVDTDLEEYSASATLLPFDPPLPLLRGPIRASPADDPSAGPFVLAFRDAASWLSTLHVTLSKLQEQCELAELAGLCFARQPAHALGVPSVHPTNASYHGGKSSLVLQQQILPRENDVRNVRWLLVLLRQRRHAFSLQRRSAWHPFEMQGLPQQMQRKHQSLFLGAKMCQKPQVQCLKHLVCIWKIYPVQPNAILKPQIIELVF